MTTALTFKRPNPTAMHAFGHDLPADPLALFARWLDDVRRSGAVRYPHATCLSTLAPDGYPDGRIVLLHHYDETGFFFMTDTRSEKAKALAHCPRAAMTFYWEPLERQVRLRGDVTAATEAEADRFFEERPRRSRVTAWASEQSRPLPDRAALDARVAAYDARFAAVDPIPRPPHWQAYRLVPRSLAFWQAAARRLHERIRFIRTADGWAAERLAP